MPANRRRGKPRKSPRRPLLPPLSEDGRRRLDLQVHPDLLLSSERLNERLAELCGKEPAMLSDLEIERRGIDARRGQAQVSLLVSFRLNEDPPASPRRSTLNELPLLNGESSVAIVGAGPAGMFCAWRLAELGIRSQVFDRGKKIRPRRVDLAALSTRGQLNPESNYCFGEGGAGTFSDGKLYTRSNKRGSTQKILEIYRSCGAPEDILIDRRPHIGTNRLPKVITEMRERLEAAGVRFHFDRRIESLSVKDGSCVGVHFSDGTLLDARDTVLATGHSAPDVLRFCHEAGAQLEAKDFAIGVRIEHPQEEINRIQFGSLADHPALGAASYRLVQNLGDVGVYSFCMCPGGTAVPASTLAKHQVVNGMSPSRRRGKYANSGFVTEVSSRYLKNYGDDVFAGLKFQSEIEMKAYTAGGGDYVAPTQRLVDFVAERPSKDLPKTSYHRGTQSADLAEVLGPLAQPIREGLIRLGKIMPGFLSERSIALGVESRTSSPLRLLRDTEKLSSVGLDGLFPCGEGAGYAGGIVSAALDGIRVAEAIARRSPRANR